MKLSPAVIKRIRKDLDRTQLTMADLLETTSTTVARWERGEAKPQPHFNSKLVKLQEYIEKREGTAAEGVNG